MTTLLFALLLVFGQIQPLVIPGERLIYDVRSERLGKIGRAEFTTTRLDSGVVLLTFDFEGRVLFFKASDHTRSELDAEVLRTLRYSKRERSPVGKRDENVIIDYATSTWEDAGVRRDLAAHDALDELSFIYLMRNLTLVPGEEQVITRHFDHARNPIRIRRRDGTAADVIEMTVPDKRQESGASVLRIHLARDEQRVPIKIESSMPIAGRVTMTLVSGHVGNSLTRLP